MDFSGCPIHGWRPSAQNRRFEMTHSSVGVGSNGADLVPDRSIWPAAIPELRSSGRREMVGVWCTAPGGGCGCLRSDWLVWTSCQCGVVRCGAVEWVVWGRLWVSSCGRRCPIPGWRWCVCPWAAVPVGGSALARGYVGGELTRSPGSAATTDDDTWELRRPERAGGVHRKSAPVVCFRVSRCRRPRVWTRVFPEVRRTGAGGSVAQAAGVRAKGTGLQWRMARKVR